LTPVRRFLLVLLGSIAAVIWCVVEACRSGAGTLPNEKTTAVANSARPFRQTLSALAVTTAVGACLVVVAIWTVPTARVPEALTDTGIAVVPPVEVEPGAGLLVRAEIETAGCDGPAEITLLVEGSAEFWRRYGRAMPTSARLTVLVSGRATARFAQLVGPHADVLPTETLARDGYTIIALTIKDWARHESIVGIGVAAPWVRQRSGPPLLNAQTCFLGVPELIGGSAAYAGISSGLETSNALARRVGRDALVTSSAVNEAESVVVPKNIEVDTQATAPAPTRVTAGGGSRWRCQARERRLAIRGRGDVEAGGPGFNRQRSLGNSDIAAPGGCGAVAVVREQNASAVRDFGLIVLGALLAWLVDSIRRMGAWRGAPRVASSAEADSPSA
jgi:hypothetical protein